MNGYSREQAVEKKRGCRAEMLRSSGDAPDKLIEKVCSKGGTTIEAMNVLRERDVEQAIKDAMAACTRRAEELGK